MVLMYGVLHFVWILCAGHVTELKRDKYLELLVSAAAVSICVGIGL